MTSGRTRTVRIAQVGTFDVENYGDLLFPLLAERRLRGEFEKVELTRYSYRSKGSESGWPYPVRPLQNLLDEIERFDLVLVGGGDIIRFDKELASGYEPEDPRLHHPTSLWLTPTLLAASHGIPVAWNAVGVPHEIPDWARGATANAVSLVAYLSVRDRTSKQRLDELDAGVSAEVVPDTAFEADGLIPPSPSQRLTATLEEMGVKDDYYIVQASPQLLPDAGRLTPALSAVAEQGASIVEVPIGPAFGDEAGASGLSVETTHPARWPSPDLITELICHSMGVAGVSMHLAIVASVFGVPAALPADLRHSKFEALHGLPEISRWPADDDAPIELQVRRLDTNGNRPAIPSAAALDLHWRRIAAAVGERTPAGKAVQSVLVSLPAQLEASALGSAELARALDLADHDREQLRKRLEEVEVERRHVADQAALLSEVHAVRQEAERLVRQTLEDNRRALEGERQRVKHLEATTTQLESDRSKLREELATATADNSRVRQALSRLEKHSSELTEQLRASEREREHLSERAQALELDRDRHAEQARLLESERVKLTDRIHAGTADRERLQTDLAARQEQVVKLQHARAQLSEEMEVERRRLADAANAARLDRDHLRAEVNALRERQAALERIATATEEWLEQLETSRSWRMTAPLRAVAGKFRRLLRRNGLDPLEDSPGRSE